MPAPELRNEEMRRVLLRTAFGIAEFEKRQKPK